MTNEYEDEEVNADVEIESVIRKRNPSLDDLIPVTDEEYASGRIYRFAHEKAWLPSVLNSRITDTTVETEDRQGFRFLVPLQVLTPKREAEKAYLEAARERAHEESKGPLTFVGIFTDKLGRVLRIKSSGVPVITQPRFGPDFDLKWTMEFEKKRRKWRKENKGKTRKNGEPVKLGDEEEEKLRREVDKQLKPELESYLTIERRWSVTPMALKAFPQTPRRPFFMIPKKPLLDVAYSFEEDYKIVFPDELVEYQYCGCENDEELIGFIRTDPDPSDDSITPPYPMKKEGGKYFIPRWSEDERGMSMRVHRECAKLVQTAKEVYLWEIRTKEFTHYYDDPLFDNYIGEKSDEGVFAWLAQEVANGMPMPEATKHSNKLRKYYEDWLFREYDRYYPCETYDYRKSLFDRFAFYGDNWASKADRIWDLVQMQVHVISYPTVVGIEPYLDIDWSTFKYYIAPIENRRDIVRIFNHWKMAKKMHNARAAGDIADGDLKNARSSDWGSLWNPILAKFDWRLMLLKEKSAADPARALRLLGPIWIKKQPWQEIDHDGALLTKFAQKWKSFWDGILMVRELSSLASLGLLPRWGKLNEKFLPNVRGYRNEYHWMLHDEYSTRDPVDAYENQAGIVTPSALDEANVRLEVTFAQFPKIRLNYGNCTNFKDFIMRMWYFQPVKPVHDAIEHELAEAEEDRIHDTLSLVQKATQGLPGKVVPQIQQLDSRGNLVWEKDIAGNYRIDRRGNRIPVYLPGRADIELMINRFRRRAVHWALDRMDEQIFPGRARAWKDFSKLTALGWPHRIGSEEESRRLFAAGGNQTWHEGVYDILQGRANVVEATSATWTIDDQVSWVKSKVNNGGLNLWYAEGKKHSKGGAVWLVWQQEIAEYLCLWAGFPRPTEEEQETRTGITYEVCYRIMEKEREESGGLVKEEWVDLELYLDSLGLSYDQKRRVWSVYCTWHDQPTKVDLNLAP